jgi:hypothetical protein
MPPDPSGIDDFTAREGLALAHAEHLVAWYSGRGQQSRYLYRSVQLTAVALSASTPVLILAAVPLWLQGLPAAVAAVLGILLTTMQWRDTWARFAISAVALRAELLRFRTRADPAYAPSVDREARLGTFVTRVTAIEAAETSLWRQGLLESSGASAGGGDQPR